MSIHQKLTRVKLGVIFKSKRIQIRTKTVPMKTKNILVALAISVALTLSILNSIKINYGSSAGASSATEVETPEAKWRKAAISAKEWAGEWTIGSIRGSSLELKRWHRGHGGRKGGGSYMQIYYLDLPLSKIGDLTAGDTVEITFDLVPEGEVVTDFLTFRNVKEADQAPNISSAEQ